MIANGVTALIVIRCDGRLALVTERAIPRAVAAGLDTDGTIADEIAVTAESGERVEAVARRLLDAGIRHLPVVDGNEILTVLSARDVLAALVGS